ncbi:hypothetical protein ECZU23_55570 [Escherichia coli]|uniref:hypothetical protein n=1 Tax=Escherichia coli TaxID=562 RepID=UPI001A15FB47|nr:hypothetical protein [Escherichia coli]GHK22137.1 hypothetical protein ECZU03_59260 [Escherichia coli]GHK68548.1 hypothetical protein ECZU11_50980 [Escherichia coli]GHL00810.1 hypothetical protein ECZU20_55590 [Escherichia coli]GHL17114.1 hypothetical protein ECZU23_55570 [Escherichia coli]GHL61853.1 hypothetical protein ECZU31_51280 [Escherichia coli]
MRNINKQELREKFEAWAERAWALPWGYLKKQRTDSGNYSDQIYTYMWLAWNSSYFELLDERDTQNKLAELEASRAALVAENELARKAVQAFCDVVGDNTEVICEEVGRDGVLVILEAMKATGNMPATDAFLDEVRAQGVEMFSEKFGGGTPLSNMVKEVAADFAAKLRKGGNQ